VSETADCSRGDWVEVSDVLLEPVDRVAGLPEDTAGKPLVAWVKGFARSDAAQWESLEIETMTGRLVTGVLADVNPGYTHSFGRPAPELTHVGADLRARLAAYRAEGRAHRAEGSRVTEGGAHRAHGSASTAATAGE
jgi:hypothetical protein